jgi:hypothetical protein
VGGEVGGIGGTAAERLGHVDFHDDRPAVEAHGGTVGPRAEPNTPGAASSPAYPTADGR